MDRRHPSARDHLDEFERIPWSTADHAQRPLETWLIKVRRFILNPIFQDRHILERVVDDLMTNLETLTGISRQDLSKYEQEHIRHLLRSAAGLPPEDNLGDHP